MLLALAMAFVCACGDGLAPLTEPPTGEHPTEAPPAFTVGGFSIQLPETVLAPGEEALPCWIFPLELTGPSHHVGGAVLHTQPGLHHGNVTTRPATGTGIRECPPGDNTGEGTDVINGGSVLFGSSTQIVGDEWYRFADGEGYRVDDGFEVVARMHYLNPSDQPVTVAPSYEWFTIDESKLTHELGAFIWLYQEFELPPHMTTTVTADCSLPGADHDMHVVSLLPHMHALGRSLDASYQGGPFDGMKFLDSPGYDPDRGVLEYYDPPVELGSSTGITYSCTWDNSYDHTIVEGIGDNEMCMIFGYAWPAEKAYTAYATPGNCIMLATPAPQ